MMYLPGGWYSFCAQPEDPDIMDRARQTTEDI